MSLYSFSQSSSSYGMPISQRSYEDMAVNRAKGTTQTALESARRQAQRMGINPNSGRYLATENNAQYDAAAQIAAAGTQASWDWLRNAQQQKNLETQMQWEREKFYNQPTMLTLGGKKTSRNGGKNGALLDNDTLSLLFENGYGNLLGGKDGASNAVALRYINNVGNTPLSLHELKTHDISYDSDGNIVDRGWGGLNNSTKYLRRMERLSRLNAIGE